MDQRKPAAQPLALTLSIMAALVRLVPHPPNFAPVGGTALFSGARIRGWQAYFVPLLAMIVTDPIRSWMEGRYAAYSWGSLVVYGCFLLSVLLGRVFLKNSSNPARIAAVTLAGSVQFFVITNFFVWYQSTALYSHDLAGLTACYIAALPFFGYTVGSDLLYTAALFSLYAVLSRKVAQQPQHTAAA